jgi:hypothetical protein
MRIALSACASTLALFVATRAEAQSSAAQRAVGNVVGQCNGGTNCTGSVCGENFRFDNTGDTGGVGDIMELPGRGVIGCVNDGTCEGNIPAQGTGGFGGAINDPAVGKFASTKRLLSVLSAICGGTKGDGILAANGQTSNNMMTAHAFDRIAGKRGVVGSASSRGTFTPGGIAEISGDAQGLVVPLAYSKWLSKDSFWNALGSIHVGHASDLLEFGISGNPAYGVRISDPESKLRYSYGYFVPLSFNLSSVSDVGMLTSYGVGGGALGTIATDINPDFHISGAVAASARYANSGVSVPFTITGRVEKPRLVYGMDAFVNLALSGDMISDGGGYTVIGAGVVTGSWQVGYQGFMGGGSMSHTLGFFKREEIKEVAYIEPVPPKPGVKPPTPLPPTPEIPPLPPAPEVPPATPECQTDMECPGDFVCYEHRCIPPE